MSKKEIVNIRKTPDGTWEFETFEKPLRTQIAHLEQQLAIYKRALELACKRIDYLEGYEDSEYMTDPFTFELLAKEEQAKESKDE